MSVVYSLYDALASIKVPDDKAKAVIDAMEREIMDKIATKSDLEHMRDSLAKDMLLFRSNVEHRFERMESRLTLKLGSIVGAWTAILFGLLKLTS